ncbi:hypothetical protein ABID21_000046 [Pseudorhizobium tarimense]|uniref:Uncharacterized protein n=1 Tax=Pseudorhizobium tarimense TaxID=1079109 RepID=A0ABV2H0A6_9HYPH
MVAGRLEIVGDLTGLELSLSGSAAASLMALWVLAEMVPWRSDGASGRARSSAGRHFRRL